MIAMLNKSALIYSSYFYIFFAFFLFQSSAFASEKIVCIGDSITAGWPYIQKDQNGSRTGGYEPLLESIGVYSEHQILVLNYGHLGETTIGGVNRIQGILDEEKPNIVLLMEGTNDLWFFSTSTVMYNLATMVDKVLKSGATPVLATITPDSRGGKPINKMNELIQSWAKENKIQLADQYAALIGNWDTQNCGDKLHPNQSGYKVIAQTWFVSINFKNTNIVPALLLLLN
jgi:lysophospholipase L1-like esterase